MDETECEGSKNSGVSKQPDEHSDTTEDSE